VLRLAPHWKKAHVLELSPRHFRETMTRLSPEQGRDRQPVVVDGVPGLRASGSDAGRRDRGVDCARLAHDPRAMERANLAGALRQIEERYADDRRARGQALGRCDPCAADVRTRERDIALSYTIPDPWEMALFIALCRRLHLDPLRQPRRHQTSVSVFAPESFARTRLWPMFADMADALRSHMRIVLDGALRDAFGDVEAAENPNGPGPLSG
jgi:hypothetical protein